MLLKRYKRKPKKTKEQEDIIKKAKLIIPNRVEYYANKMGLKYNKIYIRLQKTRWGSCSSKSNLNFNALLSLMPLDVLDSVIIHELAHLRYMNHQKEFWNFVYQFMSKEKYSECRKYLNKEGRDIAVRYLTF